jgi:hypothetical protein
MNEEPRPLPFCGLWTWDHSTNWCADPTRVESGCFNRYRKEPGSFVEDYRLLLEYSGRMEIPYLMIAGLFRDSHGGEDGAREMLAIARDNGVKVLAGFGVNAYGGFYWEGDHQWNLDTWLRQHPELEAVVPDPPVKPAPGMTGLGMACPMKDETIRWHEDGTRWLLENFDVAGIYVETGDYGVCQCDTCRGRARDRERERADQARDGFINEAIAGRVSHDDIAYSLPSIIQTAFDVRPECDVVYATYSGFSEMTARRPPKFIETIPERAVCQWTLTDMPYPEEWGPSSLRPPATRNIGYSHRGSQWGATNTRHKIAVRYIHEMCRRAATTEMEGVFIHGELSPLESIAARMNYAALAYFRKHPNAGLHRFAEEALSDELGGADEAVEAVSWMTSPGDERTLIRRAEICRDRAQKMEGRPAENWGMLVGEFEAALL